MKTAEDPEFRGEAKPKNVSKTVGNTECQTPEKQRGCFQLSRDGSQAETSKSEDRVSAQGKNQWHESKQDGAGEDGAGVNEHINE